MQSRQENNTAMVAEYASRAACIMDKRHSVLASPTAVPSPYIICPVMHNVKHFYLS